MKKEILIHGAEIVAPLLLMYTLSFLGFSKEMKKQAVAERGARCQGCGVKGKYLFAHHLLPEQFGGANTMDNLFLACSQCHPPLDKAALKKGKLGNGLNITDVLTDDPELIGNMDQFRKALHRLRHKSNESRRTKNSK